VSALEPLAQRLYTILADRAFHSGTALATRCNVSRSAVWKSIATLRSLGVTVHAVANRGYRLPSAGEPLSAERIVDALPRAVVAALREGTTVWSTGSTNADLMARPSVSPGQFDFLAAEYQSAGRGRRTRSWFAPPGGAICLSLSWSFATLPPDLSALSLAVGVCALRALSALGIAGAALKWPNDLVASGAKLGGILIELRAEAGGPAQIVIGIGLNVALGADIRGQIEASGTHAADLTQLGVECCDRNRLAAVLIVQTVQGLKQFAAHGFSPFAAEWRAADVLAGKRVVISADGGLVTGHARGIDIDGALCVQTRAGLQRYVTGDVSVRAAT
jgi:BirA family biotin operon repressor/biotin-[acetyl-CoA-carboxylase] ligase